MREKSAETTRLLYDVQYSCVLYVYGKTQLLIQTRNYHAFREHRVTLVVAVLGRERTK
jgi:hypothetical protein